MYKRCFHQSNPLNVEMRVNLYMLFSTYGEIVQVRMRQTQQLRGQAFIVFKEQMSADRALTEL